MTSVELQGPAMSPEAIAIASALADPAVAAVLPLSAPWWIWTADGARLIATNAGGARAMGLPDVARAIGRVYPPVHPFAGQVRQLLAGAAVPGEVRRGRLRVFGRFGSENAVAEAERSGHSPDGLVIVRLAREQVGDPLSHVIAALTALGLPAALLGPAGDVLWHAPGATPGGAALPVRVALSGTDLVLALPPTEAAAADLVAPAMGPATAASPVEASSGSPRIGGSPHGDGAPAADARPLAVRGAPPADPGDRPAGSDGLVEADQAAVPAGATEALAASPVSDADAGLVVPQRFAWRLSSESRFHAIDQAELAAPDGLTFAEASQRFGMDPQGAFARAIAAARPFSGVPAIWPLGQTRRLAVTLAAFPSLRDGAAPSYAGFGLVVEELAAVRIGGSDSLATQPAAAEPPAIDTGASDPEATAEAADAAAAVPEPADAQPVDAEPIRSINPAGSVGDEGGAPAATAASPDLEPHTAQPTEGTQPATEAPSSAMRAEEAVPPSPGPEVAATSEAPAERPDTDPSQPAGLSDGSRAPQEQGPAGPVIDLIGAAGGETLREQEADGRPQLTVLTKPANVVALRSSAGLDSRRTSLSPGERNAFREIARALGARTEDDDAGAPMPGAAGDASQQEARSGLPQPLAEANASDAEVQPLIPASHPDNADAEPAASAVAEPAPSGPAAHGRALAEPEAPLTVAGKAPAAREFVDSGTPFGPLPSAFGGPAGGAAPASAAAPDVLALLDRLPTGLVVHRGNAILFANRTLLDWIGLGDAAALEAAGGTAGLFAGDSQDGGGDSAAPVRLRGADGQNIPVEARLSRIAWGGEPAFLFAVTRLADEPAGETEALAELRGRLDEVEQILDTATDGIVLVTADGAIESMNRSAEALFGYESGEMKGRSLTTLFAPESHRSVLDYCDGLLSNGVASVLNDGRQVIGRVRQGGLIPLYMTMGRTGPAGRPKLAAVFRDMSQWKKAEEDLIAAKRQAEQASSQKSDFLARISHEIRTPLNAIIGFSEVMMEERFGPIGNERYRDYLKDIHASGGHVLSLINDLLDLSKIEAGRLELSFTSVDLNDIVQSTVAIMQPQANRERVIIRSSLHQRLPNVVADARSLRQIVLNLLSNSVKFTPAGGQIIISTALSDAGEAVLRVRDTGIGMTEAELKAAMEPFRQVSITSSRAAKGTGLGLPLTKALVEANRASFGISSTPNQGTLVEVVFPPTRVLAE
jgi:PAS domain S-box-containing protein